MTPAVKTSRTSRGWVVRSVSAVLVCAMMTSCTSIRNWWTHKKQSKGVLLSSRNLVPPPYAEPLPRPPAPPSSAVTPPEPIPPAPPVTPAPPPSPPAPVVQPPPVPETKPLTYKVKKGDSLWKIARMYGVSQAELADYNNMKLTDVLPVGKVLRIPPGGHYIPPEQRPKIRKKSAPKPASRKPKKPASASSGSTRRAPLPAGGKYRVKKGDSLWKIAHRYGLHVSDIRKANNLQNDLLHPGQVLILPSPSTKPSAAPAKPVRSAPASRRPATAPATAPAPAPAPARSEAATKPPEAEQPGTTGAAPVVGKTTPPPKKIPPRVERQLPQSLEHEVQAGETLGAIAELYGTTVEAIKKANPGLTNETLRPGMSITVPYGDNK